MRILITGGAGFLGTHLCSFFLKRGDTVICIDNLITGTRENIALLTDEPNFIFIQHDITKGITFNDDIDWVLHFASPASPVDYRRYPIQTLKVGGLGTHNCLGLAKEKKAKFMLASTSEIYGDPQVHPQKETYFGNVNCVGPRGCYDESKRFAEAMTVAYHRVHKLDTRIVRIFNTYGPLMRINDGRVVSNFIYQALTGKNLTVYGDGTQTRSFCYVDDLIRGIVKFAEIENEGPLNLGNPEEFTILELAREVIRLTGAKSKIKFLPLPEDDPKLRRPDTSKAEDLLGWQPKISLEEGLKRTIEWFREKV